MVLEGHAQNSVHIRVHTYAGVWLRALLISTVAYAGIIPWCVGTSSIVARVSFNTFVNI